MAARPYTRGPNVSRILLVDDDDDLRFVFREKLEYSGHEVDEADSAEAALAKVGAFDPALVVTDVRMDGMTGLELLSRIRESMEYVDVIVMTGHDTMTSAVEAMKSGAFDYLVKPVALKELVAVVDRCLSDQELNRAATEQREAQGEDADAAEPDAGARTVVGRDPRMIEIYKMIGVLSRNRATVLVRGDTGTGKEMVARAVHDHSIHSDEPFIAVNCTALTDTLLESELFGHVRGAFTGAVGGKKGYFELAGQATTMVPSSRKPTPWPISLPSWIILTSRSSPGSTMDFRALASSFMFSTWTPCISATRLRLKSVVTMDAPRLLANITSWASTSMPFHWSTSMTWIGEVASFFSLFSISSPRRPRLRRSESLESAMCLSSSSTKRGITIVPLTNPV